MLFAVCTIVAVAAVQADVHASSPTSLLHVHAHAFAKTSMHAQLYAQRELSHTKSMQAIMNNMTLTSALDIVRRAQKPKAQLLTIVQDALQSSTKLSKSLRAGSGQGKESAADKARKFLNEMIEEVQQKYDMEVQKCCEYDIEQTALIEGAKQEISRCNAEAAEGRTESLEFGGAIRSFKGLLARQNDNLDSKEMECEHGKTELRAQIKLIREDLKVMDMLVNLTDCPKTASASASLLQVHKCEDECDGSSFLILGHSDVTNVVNKLQSNFSKQLLDDSLRAAIEDAESRNSTTTWSPPAVPSRQQKRSRPCKMPKTTDKRAGKCVIGPTNCQAMQEKFLYLQSDVMDKFTELTGQLTELEGQCEHSISITKGQITALSISLSESQTYLGAATKKVNEAEAASRLKYKELSGLQAEYAMWTERCHNNYETLESESCGYKKIRGELYKMQDPANTALYTDCVVDNWVAGECSASCGGGRTTMTRKVVSVPDGGAACPMLQAEAPCEMEKCPINCILNDWTGWSSCTAKCGGGVSQRDRSVMVEPQHDGMACGETTESISCNIQACDVDCTISDWTEWTECSKECDQGTSLRIKTILTPAIGDGECPRPKSKQRYEEKHCHEFACKTADGVETLRCNSTLDVVIVLDGSGSLRQAGWDASVKAGAMLARALGGSGGGAVEQAVILFSWHAEVVQHFTADGEEAAKTIEGLKDKWPRSVTYTSKALNLAKDTLNLGRADANSVVIVITDGRPMSGHQVGIASDQLKKQARLMWVPVTRYAPLHDIKEWASYPKEDNILALNSFSELDDPESISKMVADLCPHII
eukprot:TRINITY_DN2594_c0_g1_i7.p1 TRINITY_DN2594_c0_g1~~TRINITY_DN2594_c0_g1_i7.p1  ORF type:complete len:821 (-),score=249.21 TRINITY_DN2594_c0_g1_i7:201-2663(-)